MNIMDLMGLRPAPKPKPRPEPAPDMAHFDAFTPDQVLALPGRLRRAVIADRKARVTAWLRAEIAMRGRGA